MCIRLKILNKGKQNERAMTMRNAGNTTRQASDTLTASFSKHRGNPNIVLRNFYLLNIRTH